MKSIVLYPSPGMGHLISMVELGKLLLKHYSSLSIIILVHNPPFNTGSTASYIRRVSAITPSITFHHLPTISLPLDSFPSGEALTFELIRVSTTHVHHALQSLSLSSAISAFVIDFFCTPALPVAVNLNIPIYYFITSGAGCLACFLYLPTLHRSTTKSFKDLNTLLDIPSLPPIPSSDMAMPLLDRTSKEYEALLDFSTKAPLSAGMIINTFDLLEPKAVEGIAKGLCILDSPTPPIFCIGPLIAADDHRGEHECLKWLDSQPRQSVVFLCFGSLGLFSKEQLNEIAIGLERSGLRFLWVVRNPPSDDKNKRFLPPPDPDLDLLLPAGFLDRTEGRGLVVKSWAPQVAVLSHDSVGGFVTHCGWNSVLEAVCAGVPMVAWPLYAEQRFNRVLLVEEMKLALLMNESEDRFVCATEVEKRVTELMSSENGELVRNRVKEACENARAAMSEGGSSIVALAKLVDSWSVG